MAKQRILIIGGGFGGIEAAKALKGSGADVVVIDRQNHHLFQPLLYQVATASLSPAEISTPIRRVLRGTGTRVALGEVRRIDLERSGVEVGDGMLSYDTLIVAAGVTHAYFGHPEWARLAPGLKSLSDATEIRRRILLAFESAEFEEDDRARRAALTFAIVGAGPTGVELAGAIKEIAGKTVPKDYLHIDTRTTRVLLLQGGERVLPSFPEELSVRARRDLERMGVEVRTGSFVTDVQDGGVQVGEDFLPARNVFWAAGVEGSPLARGMGVPLDGSGRIEVRPDLSVPGHPNVFVIGDLAHATCDRTGQPVPGVAQGAIQMGRHVGRQLRRELLGTSTADKRPPFVYVDKGSMAVIGRSKAIAHVGPLKVGGFVAWVLWSVIHIAFLVNFRNRVLVLMRWSWNWLFNTRDALLIIGDTELQIERPLRDGYEPHASPL